MSFTFFSATPTNEGAIDMVNLSSIAEVILVGGGVPTLLLYFTGGDQFNYEGKAAADFLERFKQAMRLYETPFLNFVDGEDTIWISAKAIERIHSEGTNPPMILISMAHDERIVSGHDVPALIEEMNRLLDIQKLKG